MSAERASGRATLTPDELAKAERREGSSHPIVSVLEQNLPSLLDLNERCKEADNVQEFIRTKYGFLADAFVAAGPYTMSATDIVQIWSFAMEHFPSVYQRYALANMVSSAYAIQDMNWDEWKTVPRWLHEFNQFPVGISDVDELDAFSKRIGEIHDSIDDIEFYVCGVENPMVMARDLARKEVQGDKEAGRQLDKIIKHQEKRQTPLFENIGENFGNGIFPIRLAVEKALEGISSQKS